MNENHPTPAREPSPTEWAEAVRAHQECLAEWDHRAVHSPGIQQTMHGADFHLPRQEK